MDTRGDKEISVLGEFKDKYLENEFFNYEMMRLSKKIRLLILLFGIIYMSFLWADYFAIKDMYSFIWIASIRILFLLISGILFFLVKHIKRYARLAFVITAYELLALLGFFLILNQYQTFTILLFFSMMALTQAIYIIPNKLLYSHLCTVFLCLSFFVFYLKLLEGMNFLLGLKMAGYYTILIIYCLIGAYSTNFYKRKFYAERNEILKISIIDPVTNIYNRAKFNEELKNWIVQSGSENKPLSLTLFDIDNFKKVNDNYGHLVGDAVMKNLTVIVKNLISYDDVFARWGGDEFVVLYPGLCIEEAKSLTERIKVGIQNNSLKKVQGITCSFGLVQMKKEDTSDSLLQRADNLLYEAKKSGKNRIMTESATVQYADKGGGKCSML